MKALSQEGAVGLANRSASGRALAPILLPLDDEAEPEKSVLVMGFLVYVRQGGFMVVLPVSSFVEEALQSFAVLAESDAPAFHEVVVELETARGRPLGSGGAVLVDLPWALISYFSPGSAVRGARIGQSLRFEQGGEIARPSRASVVNAADQWIGSNMPEEQAQDYLTGEELESAAELIPEVGAVGSPSVHGSGEPSPDVKAMLARIAELEKQLQEKSGVSGKQVVPLPQSQAVGASAKAPPLFGPAGQQDQLTEVEWTRLKRLAGPPPRVGQAEQRRSHTTQQTQEADNMLAMLEKEVEEAEQAEASGAMQPPLSGDSFHRMMWAQLQQNQMLLQKLITPKHTDPVLGALDGGGSGGGSSSSGVRGCLARDVFIQSMQDLPKIASVAQTNAARELGLEAHRVDASLMRRYAERRMPLAEHKLLTYVSFLMAEAWATGVGSNNEELMGVAAKVLIFCEQVALDQGRMALGWLMTGQQEPPFQILQSNRKRPGLQPFTRLAAPAWVSANLAYVRDLDMLESKMLTVGKAKSSVITETPEGDEIPQPKRPPKNPKRKPRGNPGQADGSEGG